MAIRKQSKLKRKKSTTKNFAAVSNKSYGKALKGVRIYFEGQRPRNLRDDGSITFGKHILEALNKKFDKFRWIITPEADSISTEYVLFGSGHPCDS